MIWVEIFEAEDQQETAFETETWKSAKEDPSPEGSEKAAEKVAEAHRDKYAAAHSESKCQVQACWIASEAATYIAW